MKTKTCSKCKKPFPATLEYFGKVTNNPDDLDYFCKRCRKEYCRKYYKENREKMREHRRKYSKKHPEKMREQNRKYSKKHPEKVRESGRKYRKENREKVREYGLMRYNLTTEEYSKLFQLQNGVCAICGLPETVIYKGKVRKLAVDHDHVNNKIRGLLCMKCNSLLGYSLENIKILLSAASYLRRNS